MMKYTLTERMAFELGLQTAKTAVEFLAWMPEIERNAVKHAIEQRATELQPEMRVIEPARKNPNKNLN